MVDGYDFRPAKSLTHLQLENCQFTGVNSPALPVWFPNSLKILQISGVIGMRLEEHNLPHLDRLEIGSCSRPQDIVEKLLHEGPILVNDTLAPSLDTGNTWADPNSHQQIRGGQATHDTQLPNFCRLKTFKIECKPWLANAYNSIMRRMDDLELTLTHPRLSEIENLVLVGGGVDDTLIEGVMEESRSFSRNLSQIAFDSARISGISMKLLVEQEKNLEAIWLVNCDGVGSDAVEWAQGRGVNVQVRRK
jgi:hypothetical protein